MSFINTVLKAIGTEFEKVFDGAENELKTVILPAAIAVTNAAKAVIDADTSDIIGALAGSAGKSIEDKVRQGLDIIVPKLQMAQQFLAAGGTTADILAKVVTLLGSSPAVTKTAFYIEFSGLVAQYLADGKLTTGEAVVLAQYWYHNSPTVAGNTGTPAPIGTPAAAATGTPPKTN